jgi:hypothetical protein
MTDSRPHWANTLFDRHKYHEERFAIAKEFGDLASADLHAAISAELIDVLEELGQLVR